MKRAKCLDSVRLTGEMLSDARLDDIVCMRLRTHLKLQMACRSLFTAVTWCLCCVVLYVYVYVQCFLAKPQMS
jgi:hypothetical protein